MASDDKREPVRRTWLRKALLAIATMVFLLIAASAWLLGTASGARAAFSGISALSDGVVDAQGIDGRLAGQLRVARLTLRPPDTQLVLDEVRLDWRPLALLQNRLHLKSLRVGHLAIATTQKESKPASLPQSISLPFQLQADEVSVDSGEIKRGPVSLLKLGAFAFALDFEGARYLLRLHRFAAGSTLDNGEVATSISGEARLSSAKPYALQGSFISTGNATIGERAIGANGKIDLNGSLTELVADLGFTVNRARIEGNALLRPFSAQPLHKAHFTARALDLSALDPNLPRSAFDIDLSAVENGHGELTLANTEAGLWNDKKIPLTALAISFRQDAGLWHFDRIASHLGTKKAPAGALAGSGRYTGGALALALHTDALDLKRLDSRARATRLAGDLELRHAAGKQEFTLALNEPLGKQRIVLDAHGTLADTQLSIDRLQVRAGQGSLDASARLSMAGTQGFSANGDIKRFRLQDLGNFPQLPALELNGGFALSGVRQPQLEADLKFSISDSRLAGQPLSGDGEAELRGERLRVPHFVLASGANRLKIEGQLSGGDARLTFALNAPQLAQLGPAFGGALAANGEVRGSVAQPRIDAQWSAVQARLPGNFQIEAMQGKARIGIDRKRAFILDSADADISARGMRRGNDSLRLLSAQLRFGPRADAPLALTIDAEGITAAGIQAQRLHAGASGSTARHALEVTLQEAGQSWALKANGGLAELETNPRWQGQIHAFDAGGRFQARLAAPAALLLSARKTLLERFVLDADSGRIAVEHFARDAQGIDTRGHIERLQLAQLLRHAAPATPVKTDLQLSGKWNLRMGETLTGELALQRDQGDLTVLGGVPLTLGLRELRANATAQGGRLALQLEAHGQRLGSVDINAATVIGQGSQRLSIAPDAPVTGSARIAMPSIAWIGPLISASIATDGRLQGDVSLGGSFAQPRLSGRVSGEALKLRMAQVGIDLSQGVLDGEFEGERLQIRSLAFQGAEGRVTLSGPIDLGGGAVAAQLMLRAERFALLNRGDRRIVLSGESRLAWQDQRGKLSGAYTIDSGFIDLGHADTPQLSSDVVVVGRERKAPARSAVAIDLELSLGEGVKLTGRGIDALLGGKIRILSDAGDTLQAQGAFNVIKGTYSAYGRELDIEQGGLRFRGALANPTLNLLAMRRGQEVEAGVSVRGSVLAPRVTLVSEPTVPDAEKLSWLVLGRGLSSAGASDAGTLQTAAGALLSEGARAAVQSRIAGAVGLDTVNVGTSSDTLQQHIVTLGKQISSKLYVSYQQGLESAASVVSLRYILSPKLSVEAEAGTRSAISLFYNIAFD